MRQRLSWCCAQAAAGWGGGGAEKEEEEGRGGQRGSRISETRPQNRLCFPSGKGPQDA